SPDSLHGLRKNRSSLKSIVTDPFRTQHYYGAVTKGALKLSSVSKWTWHQCNARSTTEKISMSNSCRPALSLTVLCSGTVLCSQMLDNPNAGLTHHRGHYVN